MSDIPENVLAAAERTLDLMLCNCHEAGDVRAESIRDIAKAIFAERERAVQIIEARLPLYTDIGQRNALKECISSIRSHAH